jgi:signal transduction histidine kinase
MTDPVIGSPPELTFNDFSELLASAPLFVGIHSPVFDEDGSIVDFQLVWWNDFYARVRRDKPVRGQSMMATYLDPTVALDLATRAWRGDDVSQEFDFDFPVSEQQVYSWQASTTVLSVRWFRYRDLVAEVAQDVTELKSIENRLLESDLELLEAWRLQETADIKQELARDMHDSVIQRLLAVGIGVRHTLNTTDVSASNRAQAELIIRNVDEAIDELRSIVDTLMSPTTAERVGGRAEEAILDVIDSMTPLLGHRPAYSFNNRCELSDDLKYDVSAVVRESLANVAQHAEATRSFVHVECRDGLFTVRVLDDGVGPQSLRPGGYGLANLAERAARHGGFIDLSPRPDRPGSRLKWSIPCPGSAADPSKASVDRT